MPQVLTAMAQVRPIVVTLPNPRLQQARNVTKPRDMLGAMKRQDGIDFAQRRMRAVQIMERELAARGQEAFGKPLKRKR